MEETPVIDLMRKRRSIRLYKTKPVDRKSLTLLIEAALRAPSSNNRKPCEFIVVDDPALLEKLSDAKERGSQFLKGAALGIIVCGDAARSDAWIEDCSIASILVQMTVQALKLGSCWIQIRNRKRADGTTSEEYIQKLMGLPDNMKVESIISIGHPAEKKEPVPKAQLAFDKIRYNNYSEKYISSGRKSPAKKVSAD
jgi:nitroreductase